MESFAELRRKYQKDIDEMCLMDDNFMSAVLQDKACCELVLEIILNRKDIEVIECETQYTVTNLHGRAVRLGVLARDESGALLNIEVQRADSEAVPRRARYNSSMIDADTTKKGTPFKDLPETYVIFITENDILKENRPIYTINRVIAESGNIFNDGTHIIYVNSQIRDDTALGRLMHDFLCKDPQDMHYDVLSDTARLTKEREDEKGMCKIIDDIVQRERKEAEEIAKKESSIETALRLIKMNILSLEEIAAATSLSIDEVKKLAEGRSA